MKISTQSYHVNLLGALTLLLYDRMERETVHIAGRRAMAASALTSLLFAPGLPIEALARILDLSHSACVRLIDRLVEDGLVERRAAPDLRAVALHLTAAGRVRAPKILQARYKALSGVFEALSTGEQKLLAGLLEKLLYNLTEGRGEADHTCRLCDEASCTAHGCPVEDKAMAQCQS